MRRLRIALIGGQDEDASHSMPTPDPTRAEAWKWRGPPDGQGGAGVRIGNQIRLMAKDLPRQCTIKA